MVSKYNDELSIAIITQIMEARNYEEYKNVINEMTAISHASKFAKGRSSLECDLKRFMSKNKHYYSEAEIDKIMKELQEKIGEKVQFRTLVLFACLESRLVKEIQVLSDPWETAKLIYSLAILYEDDKNSVLKVIEKIKDEKQRRIATICARVYFKGFEEVFEVFSLNKEI